MYFNQVREFTMVSTVGAFFREAYLALIQIAAQDTTITGSAVSIADASRIISMESWT